MSAENEVEDERKPAEEEGDEVDGIDVYEIIKSPGIQEDDYWNVAVKKLSDLDLSRRPVYQQLGVGGVSGWFVGSVFKKVGKIAALTIGGGLLMLQVASQSGYVTINWDKIGKDVRKVSKGVNSTFEEYSSEEQQGKIAKYFKKSGKVVQKNMVVASGFAGGFLLGLAT